MLNRRPKGHGAAARLDRRHGEPVVLIDTSTTPATAYPVARARVTDRGAGIALDGGRLVATGPRLEVRLAVEHWPRGLPLPDSPAVPPDRLRVVRGDAAALEDAIADAGDDLALLGDPVARLRRPAGAIVLEVT